ncbi:MAG: O-antigen ligase family protein [Halothiobacillaceae bacterium]|nr:O-antigen ligase family protein [Halothiobacillaceae bacterium]
MPRIASTPLEWVTALILLAYPSAMLTIRGGMNGILILMLLLIIGARLTVPGSMGAWRFEGKWAVYILAMFGMTAAIFISQLMNGAVTAHPHDAASRYWLSIPVLFFLLRMRPSVIQVVQYAFPVAAILGWLLPHEYDPWGRSGLGTMDLVRFGKFELLLGTLSLLTWDWAGRDKLPVRALKLAGFAAGVAASIYSGTRGGWLAVPVFVLIGLYLGRARVSRRGVALGLLAVMLGMSIAYTFNDMVRQRVAAFQTDIRAFEQGDRDTSLGIRWALYAAAADIISRHPLFGIGPTALPEQLEAMKAEGRLTALATEVGSGELHNDVLAKTVGMGVPGLVAILAVYLVPLWLFWGATGSASAEIRRAGLLGLVFVTGFMVFGMTAETLNLTMTTAFYGFTVATLLAACYNEAGPTAVAT